ncbi:inhibitor of apoptosis protein 2 [Orgyia leucostigma nucleopolyhedrovirus]|uniref:Inhibitor of apoptosis protein 2 n=1 Tax=Orgyia leucostigma nucleopolyhedrovirus TaxID=490711 RepID=B0FDT1_9ABAC|nr:inhibitor of apoptosis protein 2 [Orgyia leucostigma nucleopolyhedrovirus]ABY65789.1 inhibitor of apoptosis protein 2 [Orgyia leucostigma nucleopolyhedrovirus]
MNFARVMAAELSPPASMPFNYKNAQTRFDSFSRLGALLMSDEKRNLAHHGMYYDGATKTYRCAYCPAAMGKCCARAIKYHKFSAACPRSAELLRVNRALRRFSFSVFKAARVRYEKRRDELADNGFHFDATRLKVKCSGCGMIIEQLCKDDNVRAVHQLYSPRCVFVYGDSACASRLDQTHNLCEDEKPFACATRQTPSAPVLSDEDVEQSTRNLTSTMQSLQIVDRAESLYPKLNCKKTEQVVEGVNSNDEVNESSKTPTVSVVASPEDRMCKICFERERQICFAPCGHLSTCERCAQRCVRCCMCRKPVKDKIRVFI